MMKSVSKHALLESLENQVELHMQEAIKEFQNMRKETLLKPASDGGWSIAQCLEHLNSYGHYYLPEIKKALQQPSRTTPSDLFKSSWLGSYFTKMMDPQTGKRKMKAFKNHTPARTLDAHAVVAEFIHQQETLLQYLRDAHHADLNKTRIPISIARWLRLKLGDVFQFIIAHDERHLQQAKRNCPVSDLVA